MVHQELDEINITNATVNTSTGEHTGSADGMRCVFGGIHRSIVELLCELHMSSN
jgi:hypothetical protein